MKTLIVVLSAIGLLSLNGCKQESDPQVLLENSNTRTELFSAIIQNHEYMMEFMETMHSNEHALQMMKGDKKMMSSMMHGEGMQMMMTDSIMMKNIMQVMMKDGKILAKMIKMIHEKGIMSEDCMESTFKIINEKENFLELMNMMEEMNKKGSH